MWIHQIRQEEYMSLTSLLIFVVVGAVAGWLAGIIMKGGGFGLVGNIIVGIIGSFIGAFLFRVLGITAGGMLGSIVVALVGAIVLLYIVKLIKK
jgi:uncharacterized membrane protein YeaQ/YmgE (transglycosylase-associated protein family)